MKSVPLLSGSNGEAEGAVKMSKSRTITTGFVAGEETINITFILELTSSAIFFSKSDSPAFKLAIILENELCGFCNRTCGSSNSWTEPASRTCRKPKRLQSQITIGNGNGAKRRVGKGRDYGACQL